MPKKGGKRKKTRTHQKSTPEGAKLPDSQAENIPRSIVARIGKVSPMISDLVQDIRRVMGPYTAMNLKEKRYNRMKDYASVAGHLGVTHLLIFSQTESNVILRIARHPDGPTLHFRVKQFMPPKLIKAMQKRPYESEAAFHTPPVLVLNNFNQSDEQQVKLMKVTFQHMYRTINVNTVKLSDCRRVVLYHFMPETGNVEMRHYAVRANPVGISRNVKKIIQSKIPDLSNLEDISEFIEGNAGGFGGNASDSEAEDEASKVTLPDRFVGRGNAKAQLSAMKLTELGPRLTLELFKVEQGVNEGDILYHKFVHKTPEEAAAIKARIERERALKEQRRKVQEDNVKRKREALEEKKAAREERKKRRLENGEALPTSGGDEDEDEDEDEDDDEEDEESVDDDAGDYQDNDYDLDDEEVGDEEEDDEEDEDNDDEEDDDEDDENGSSSEVEAELEEEEEEESDEEED